MHCRSLRWGNAALFVIQRLINAQFEIAPTSRRHPTLITPAPYAFVIWGAIYTFISIALVVDCCCPVLSMFSYMHDARRLLFTVVCIANVAWTIAFTSEWIHLATLILIVLWSMLAWLYVDMIKTRREYGWSIGRYICSELGFTMYFAWSSAATLISVAVSIQAWFLHGGYLSAPWYLVLLSLLTVLSISTNIYAHDCTTSGVAIWALIAIAKKQVENADDVTQHTFFQVQVAAIQSSIIIILCILMTIVKSLYARFLYVFVPYVIVSLLN